MVVPKFSTVFFVCGGTVLSGVEVGTCIHSVFLKIVVHFGEERLMMWSKRSILVFLAEAVQKNMATMCCMMWPDCGLCQHW